MPGIVYLIPSFIDETNADVIPPHTIVAMKDCHIFFVENERSARRFLKTLWKEMVIDNYRWVAIHKAEEAVKNEFLEALKKGQNAGVISEAGCPGIADPGQILVEAAQRAGITVKPLVGPSSILLALMASGMNGQQFQFIGYLPIEPARRAKTIHDLEVESSKKNCTQLFIETPYRNNQLFEALLKNCRSDTKICIAADITGTNEFIKTRTIQQWKKEIPDLNKHPAIFVMNAGPA